MAAAARLCPLEALTLARVTVQDFWLQLLAQELSSALSVKATLGLDSDGPLGTTLVGRLGFPWSGVTQSCSTKPSMADWPSHLWIAEVAGEGQCPL